MCVHENPNDAGNGDVKRACMAGENVAVAAGHRKMRVDCNS